VVGVAASEASKTLLVPITCRVKEAPKISLVIRRLKG
jgi:hypothetical protein